MSYCRFAWDGSDVYVFESDRGFECCGCHLRDGSFLAETPEEMIAHLAEHRRAGQFVPFNAITGLWRDIPGPDVAVEPEPQSLTEIREAMDRFRQEKRGELAAEFSHL